MIFFLLLKIFVTIFLLFDLSLVAVNSFDRAREISVQKCEEYKDLTAEKHTFSGRSMDSESYTIKLYPCRYSASQMVIGGSEASEGEFPHMATISCPLTAEKYHYKCSGSLISEKFVLSVAHCVHGVKFLIVRLGAHNLSLPDADSHSKKYGIEKIIVHQNYDETKNTNDIALIKLDTEVTFNDFIRPACLQSEEFLSGNVVVTGWGKTRYNREIMSDVLMKASLTVIPTSNCKKIHKVLESNYICAGGRGKNCTSDGDSGGPIQVSHENAWCVYNIIGLTSRGGSICYYDSLTAFTRVSSYIEWIVSNVWPELYV